MEKPFPAQLLEQFYSCEQGIHILRCCNGGMMEALQSIAELQSQSYILHKGADGNYEQFPWTVTYHFQNSETSKQRRESFSLETTSFWVDTSLRTSCRLKSNITEIPSELVAAFATGLAMKMSSWNLVSISFFYFAPILESKSVLPCANI